MNKENIHDWQYLFCHNNPYLFEVGQKVFLKSNKKRELIVKRVTPFGIIVNIEDDGTIRRVMFPPQVLLPYELSCLLVYKNKFTICLN